MTNFIINGVSYMLHEEAYSKCKILEIMAEQYSACDSIRIKLSKNILTIPNIDKHVAMALGLLYKKRHYTKYPKSCDLCITILKFLK